MNRKTVLRNFVLMGLMVLSLYGDASALRDSKSNLQTRSVGKISVGSLAILDISEAFKPKLIATVELGKKIAGKSELCVADGYAYIASYKTVYIVDIQEPKDAKLLNSFPIEGYHSSCAIDEKKRILYIVNNRGLHIVDVAIPQKEKILFEELMRYKVDSPVFQRAGLNGTDIALYKDRAIVTTAHNRQNYSKGFSLVLDVTELNDIKVIQTLYCAKNPNCIAATNRNVFIGGDTYGEFLWNLSDYLEEFAGGEKENELPAAAVDIQFVPFEGIGTEEEQFAKALEYTQQGNKRELQRLIAMVTGRAYGKLYIACEHSLEVRSVPPQYNFSVGNFERLHALEVIGETAYLAAGREGIVVVDLSEKDPLLPKQPKIVEQFSYLPLEALDISSYGNYLYVLYGNLDIWAAVGKEE